MTVFLLLFLEFFKTGLFAIGGGLATLPFLYDLAEKYTWFDVNMLSDMIAISESTPGPIGVNMATYAGYNAGHGIAGILGGILGALCATIGLITPSIIIILIAAKFLEKFKDNKLVDDAFYLLRPAVTALIAVAAVAILQTSLFYPANGTPFYERIALPAVILLVVMLIASNIWKKLHPIVFIAVAAVVGIIFKM